MRAIAERSVERGFALAEANSGFFLDDEFLGL
jgi:hypothetical protein